MSVFAKISIKKSACHSYMELLLTGLTGVRLSPIASFPHPPDQIQPATVRCVCVCVGRWGSKKGSGDVYVQETKCGLYRFEGGGGSVIVRDK